METYLIIILIAYLLVAVSGYWLEYLNLSFLKKNGALIPSEFEGQIDLGMLCEARDYTVEKTKFGYITSIFSDIIILIFIFGGLLDAYNSWIVSLDMSFMLSGLVFFMFIVYIGTFMNVPFEIYSCFKIEKKYGFNTMSMKLWITDFIKSILLSTVMIAVVITIGLWIIQINPHSWWLWVWCFFFVFGLFVMYISPYVIEPLFNKYISINDKSLEESIHALMKNIGIKVSKVFKIDASRRTKHTNAYFTGIGKVKRIVLYDTLFEKMDRNEILSVLAHEAGHWKKKHIVKMIIITESIALIVIYLSYMILQTDFLSQLFHIDEETFFAKIIIIAFLGSIISFPFTPLFNYFSRRYEKEADRFSFELTGNTENMINALVKLSKDNLSNLHPHPLYAAFHYSHPPVLERIKRIREMVPSSQ